MSIRKHSRKQNSNKSLEPPYDVDGQSIAPGDLAHASSNEQIKYEKPFQAAMGLFREYCGSSTVHGVRYFTERNRHFMERAWWFLAFVLALLYCTNLIQSIFIKWEESFDEKSTPVWEIPLPAVTICPETKATMSKLNFTEVFDKMYYTEKYPYDITEEEDKFMSAVVQICEPSLSEGLQLGTNFTDSSIVDLLRDVAPSFDDTMFICKFRNNIDNCRRWFTEIVTEEGLCFTFNELNGSELYTDEVSPDYMQINNNMSANFWDLEQGYSNAIKTDSQIYPYRVFDSAARAGLFILLRLYEQNLDYICRGPVQGFKLLLHTPGEVPQVSKHYIRVPLLQEVLVAVKPHMITTSEGLRGYEPNRACGCVKFSMPRDADRPICGAAKIGCYTDAEDNLLREQFEERLTLERGAERVKGCNCLPACTSIIYDAEISPAPFDWISLFNAYQSPLDEFPGMQPSRLSIFFKENQFVSSKYSELYGLTDFLADCGGLLGLFLGASFLSIVELLYFFTLRLCCNLSARRHRKRKSNTIADSVLPSVSVVKLNDDREEETQN